LKFPVLWNVMSCYLVDKYGSRSAVCCPHLQLMMEAEDCSEISVYIYQFAQLHIPKYSTLHTHYSDNWQAVNIWTPHFK